MQSVTPGYICGVNRKPEEHLGQSIFLEIYLLFLTRDDSVLLAVQRTARRLFSISMTTSIFSLTIATHT